ncbi:MAG: DMT family transporter [Acidimicrobiia bacterium]
MTANVRSASGVRGYFPELAIAAAAFLYGVTFSIVQDALDHTTPMGFNLLRFSVGALVLAPFALRRPWAGPRLRPSDSVRTFLLGGASLGVIAAFAYLTQNIGLQHTSTSNSAFITGLFAVFTPIVEAIVYRRFPRSGIVLAVAISVVGLFLLTGAELSMSYGDAITLVTAVLFGCWYVRTGMLANRFDIFGLTTVQLAVVALISIPFVVVDGFGQIDAGVVATVIFTGIGCSAVAFSLSAWAQRTIDPSRASILNLLEPVVAGIVGYAVGERLGFVGYVGAALILAGIFVAERGTHETVTPDLPGAT